MVRRRSWTNGLTVAILLLGAACGDGGDGPRVTSPPTTTGTATPDGSPDVASAAPTAGPSTPDGDAEVGVDSVGIRVAEVATGFEHPLHVLPAPAGGLLVVEQTGRIRLLRDGEITTYLDLADRVVSGGERGLLGATFRDEDGERVFVHYSGADGRTTLSSFAAGADTADPDSEEILLTVDQPAANHNGGQLLFGPDGHLYLGLGDGGAANDRFGNGQDPATLLGTILRLDVRAPGGYDIPPDNPFADGQAGAPEVWAYGLRNPYRLDFGAGRLFIADVGQNAIEEVNAEPADAAGVNYGWPILEGPDCFGEPDCDPSGTVLPVTSYRHEETGGCAIIGGEVYEGRALPALVGWYVYSDLCAGFVRAIRVTDTAGVEEVDLTARTGEVPGVLGFGHDADGELLLATQDGRVLRLVPA